MQQHKYALSALSNSEQALLSEGSFKHKSLLNSLTNPGGADWREGDIRTLLQFTSTEKQILGECWNQNKF